MRSIRWRLTLGYALALVATLVAFGGALYVSRARTSLRTYEQDLERRLQVEAEFYVHYLDESHRVLGRLVTRDTAPALEPSIASFFESIRDYLVLTDRNGRVLFTSDTASALPIASYQRLRAPLQPLPQAPRSGIYTFDDAVGSARFVALPVTGAGAEVGAILVAAPGITRLFDAEALLSSMLVIAPIILGASVLLGYWVAGRSLQPLGDMIRELEAITDGRSLHRRLAVDRSAEEVARLGHAVNRMFERLERSFAALRRFTADASHELKTPLMVLRAGVERALTNPGAPPESLQALDDSLLEINRMAELVDSLLTLARADEGRLPIETSPCDLRELVSEAAETASMLGEIRGLTVRAEIPPEPVVLPVDRPRLRNLATNAVKYTPAGGTVSLGLSDQGAAVTLTVADTGIGIAAGDLPHIFDRFWRADPARTRQGERPGSGLGLAITKWIAEAHGGTITVQSRPGRGTSFIVTLPRASVAAASIS